MAQDRFLHINWQIVGGIAVPGATNTKSALFSELGKHFHEANTMSVYRGVALRERWESFLEYGPRVSSMPWWDDTFSMYDAVPSTVSTVSYCTFNMYVCTTTDTAATTANERHKCPHPYAGRFYASIGHSNLSQARLGSGMMKPYS